MMMMKYSRAASTGFIKDFQDFVIKGNIFDLAIAIVIGIAFNNLIESFLKDVIIPAILTPLLQASGARDLESWTLGTVKLGLFCSNAISFTTIAFVVFLMIRAMAAFKRREQRLDAADSQECPYCLSTIPIAAIKCAHCTSDLPSVI
jgi:large conductance mechanosensitive channel